MAESKPQEEEKETPTAPGGKQTPLNEASRKTGQETNMDTREGAAPEAPGARSKIEGSPNQGTESR